jgi:AcrR family transcriptional regulator
MSKVVSKNETNTANDAPQEALVTSAKVRRRSFKGLSLEVRQAERRERLMEAGLQSYGTMGYFAVTVRDVCIEAKLTERYFYESFKNSGTLFDAIFMRLVEDLQQCIVTAVMQGAPDPKRMVHLGLTAFFRRISDDQRMTRILFIDAILVHENDAQSMYQAFRRFDLMTQSFIALMVPKAQANMALVSLISTGLTGYVSHLATRWALSGFKETVEDLISACMVLYEALFIEFQLSEK